MSITSIKQVPLGAMVSFRSKNANDTVMWQGTLVSLSSYLGIRGFSNPQAENEAVRQTDPTVSSDVTTLTYFVIVVDNDAVSPTNRVFADEWIAAGSLNQISLGSQVTVLVKDPNNNPNQIISILANAGYAATIQSS